MISVFVQVKDPTINIMKIHDDDRCLVLQTKTNGEDVVTLHFDTPEDLDAWLGLVQIARQR